MTIRRIGQAACWITVAALGLLSTAGSLGLLVGAAGRHFTGAASVHPGLLIVASVALLVPLWAMVAVIAQAQRDPQTPDPP